MICNGNAGGGRRVSGIQIGKKIHEVNSTSIMRECGSGSASNCCIVVSGLASDLAGPD